MSLLDSITDLATGTYTVTRRLASVPVNGIFTLGGAPTTFTITASIQPATGMQRVVGGRDMRTPAGNEYVDDVRVVYTDTELLTRTPANEPDVVAFDGGQWTVFRMEHWELGGQIYWRATMSRQTLGAS